MLGAVTDAPAGNDRFREASVGVGGGVDTPTIPVPKLRPETESARNPN